MPENSSAPSDDNDQSGTTEAFRAFVHAEQPGAGSAGGSTAKTAVLAFVGIGVAVLAVAIIILTLV